MMYLMFIIFLFLYCESEAMDPERGETRIPVAASDNIIVKVQAAIVSQLAGLKPVIGKDSVARSYTVSHLRSYYPAQHLKQLMSYIASPETITRIENKHELEATAALLGELGSPLDIMSRCKRHADTCIAQDVPIPHEGLLNLCKQKYSSCIGLDLFASDQVTELNLSENRIRRFDLRYLLHIFPELRKLNCSENEIDLLKRSMLLGMPAGFTLAISGNQICRVEKGVGQILISLRDRSVRLCLRDTLLNAITLGRLADKLEGVSCRRRCRQIAFMSGEALSVIACFGCAMARGMLLDKDESPLWSNVLLFSGFLLFLGGSIALIAAESFYDCCLNDNELPSKCEL